MVIRIVAIDGLRPRIPDVVLVAGQQHLGNLGQQLARQIRHKRLQLVRMRPQHDERLDRQAPSDGVGRQRGVQQLDQRPHDVLGRCGLLACGRVVHVPHALEDPVHDFVLEAAVLDLLAEDVGLQQVEEGVVDGVAHVGGQVEVADAGLVVDVVRVELEGGGVVVGQLEGRALGAVFVVLVEGGLEVGRACGQALLVDVEVFRIGHGSDAHDDGSGETMVAQHVSDW